MKTSSPAQTPEEYLSALPQPRQAELRVLHEAICQATPELTPHVRSGMLGYGTYHYRYESGREGDWFIVGLASRKAGISLHLCVGDGDGYLAEKHRARLGKVTTGRSCVTFKRLADLNLPVALELVRQASRLAPEKGCFAP